MTGFLTIAEYATLHRDGTITLLRMGISKYFGQLPIGVTGFVYVEVPASELQPGTHEIQVHVEGPEAEQIFMAKGMIAIGDPTQIARFHIPLGGEAHAYGSGELRASVGTCEMAMALTFDREERPATAPVVA